METGHHDNTRGIAIGGLVTGIAGTALNLLGNGGLSNLFGGTMCGCQSMPNVFSLQEKECEDKIELTKAIYENRLRDIAELNAFREKDITEKFSLYKNDTDNYQKLSERIATLEKNEAIMAAVEPYRTKILNDKIALEAERRNCADQKIISYLNGNFQPLYVADITPAATSTEREIFNPLCCGCGKF